MMVKRKLDGEVDESSANGEIHKSDETEHTLRKMWRPTPSRTGSYGRLEVRQTKFRRGLKF